MRIQVLDHVSIPAASAPASGWRRVLTDWLVVSGATAVCHAMGAVTSLLLRMLLSPAQMGVWQAIKMLLSYGNYANLGISKGAIRDYTIALGRGKAAESDRGLNLAFTFNTITSLLYAVILFGAAIWVGWSGEGLFAGPWAVGLIVAGGLAILSRYVSFQVTILRAQQAFALTSRLSILEAALTLAIGGAATWLWGLEGLYFGTLVVLVAAFLFVQTYQRSALRWAFDGAEIRRLIGVGAPILLAGTMITVFRSLDKLMILSYLSDREFQLGCYSVALMVSGQLYGLGNMLSVVMNPRYGEKFGQTGSRREVALLAAVASELHAAAMVLPAALAVVLAVPILHHMLPDYRSGLPAVIWLAPATVALILSLPAGQYLVAVGRERRALLAILPAIPLAALGNHLALTGSAGLAGVAAATAFAYVAYTMLVVAVSFWQELDRAGRRRYLVLTALGLAPTLTAAIALELRLPGQQAGLAMTVGKAAAVIVVWALSCGLGWHWGGWRGLFRNRRRAF